MTVINTNIAATMTANSMRENQRTMENTMERLSTGKRINSASDDAAGLAIETRMDSQIRGLGQASRNANDGISMLQTMDGAAEQMTDMLQRMRELSVQARTGTLGADDVANLNQEFAAMASEIDRIATDTTFNNFKILDGTAGTNDKIQISVGADETDTISIDMADFQLANGAAAVGESLDTATIALDDNATVAALASGKTMTFTDGTTTLSLSLGDVQENNTRGGVITAADVTQAELANGMNALVAATSNFKGTFAASGVADTGLVVTERTGFGGGTAVFTLNGEGVTLVNSAAMDSGTPGAAAGVMGADLSAFKDTASAGAGTNVEDAGVLVKIDNAIKGIATARASIGASVNRLEYTVDNLNTTIMNTQAAKSQIVDADYASETTELARTQIISQASTAMLSQANQQAQSVLALLK
jgi:flagellin